MPSKKSPPRLKWRSMHTDSPLWETVDEFLKNEIGKRRPRPAEIERSAAIADLLFEEFPSAHCALHFETPFQLLVATILSAQCTDERVNLTTPELWRQFPRPEDLAAADQESVEQVIRSTGFYRNKAKAIRETAQQFVEKFGSNMPTDIEQITELRGAARKTANVMRMHAFGLPGISVDTHVTRLSERLKLSKSKDAVKIEADLAALLPPERWTHFADALILHGRKTCNARKPNCEQCRLSELCPSAFKVKVKAPKKKAAASKAKKTA